MILIYLFVFFVLLPIVELALLLWLGQVTDWKVSLFVVIATGAIGSILARRQGIRALRRVQSELQQGHLPADALLDSLMIFVAGVLLITPGLISDLLGISLLIPQCRSWYKRMASSRLKAKFQMRWGSTVRPATKVVDSYVVSSENDRAGNGDESSKRIGN